MTKSATHRNNASTDNSADSMREYRLGPLMILCGWARDPDDRLWGHTDPGGTTRMRHLWSVHYLDVPCGEKVWGVYIGPLCLYWRFDTRRYLKR